ncbi:MULTISPECIES: hypothetical protein [Bacillus]|uniref:DUF1433 domain-containing protein n=3 Tax=Bacillus TaxID=1386 RepID=A0A2B0X508_BACAN|nr:MULTISPECIES: hypothetical protein [Bacillus]MCU0097803.1 hypothetical protein [Bacillus sp. OR9]KZD36343.1 hypothetical protein B4082_2372 [Bacillus cereus]MBJ8061619.1 hypothetical protein [Bacillus cereus]MCU4759302.1 hypothetical protein [Bacillus cereus]MCU5108641.1 hypothetical protein [Bacillus cereus]
MKKILLVTFLLILGVGSCTVIKFIDAVNPIWAMSSQEQQEIKDKAKKATIEYFKKEKNVDVTITNAEFSGEMGGLKVFVDGYISNDKNKGFSVKVSTHMDYEVKEFFVD